MMGFNALVLTTIGRKSGLERGIRRGTTTSPRIRTRSRWR